MRMRWLGLVVLFLMLAVSAWALPRHSGVVYQGTVAQRSSVTPGANDSVFYVATDCQDGVCSAGTCTDPCFTCLFVSTVGGTPPWLSLGCGQQTTTTTSTTTTTTLG